MAREPSVVKLAQRGVALVALITLGVLSSACAGSSQSSDPKVWSSSSSADGYAGCPMGTTVVGGGHEIHEAYQVPGKLPYVVSSTPHGNGWRVVCTDDKGAASPACKAWVVCASVLK